MNDLYIRMAYIAAWLLVAFLLIVLGKLEKKIMPFVFGLIFIPVVEVAFYGYSVAWRLGLIEVEFGFFSDLSIFRSGAIAINLIAVLVSAIAFSWYKRRCLYPR